MEAFPKVLRPRVGSWRTAVGAQVMALALAMSLSCAKQGEEPAGKDAQTEQGNSSVASNGAGRRGGKLILAMAGDPKTFNPPIITDVLSQNIRTYLFLRLYDYDRSTQQPVPRLAESWEYNEETSEWTFRLREGLRWSDGYALTSDDVLFAAEAIMDPSVPAIARDYLIVDGKHYEFSAPDPLTFVAKIPAVDSMAIIHLLEIYPLPRHIWGKALASGKFAESLTTSTPPEQIVTSGPFRVKQFKSGDRLELERNPYYYRTDAEGNALPYLDQVALVSVPDFDAMALRFQAGHIDMIEDPIQPQNLVTLRDEQVKGDYAIYNPGLSLRNTHYWFNLKPGGSYRGPDGKQVVWEPAEPNEAPPAAISESGFKYYVEPHKRRWFDQVEFRRACSMLTNRDAIVKTVLYGEGAPLWGFESESNKQWNNPDIAKYPYDPEGAAQALEVIGMIDRDGDGIREDRDGNPIRFTLITNKENRVRDKIGVLLKEDFTQIGFDVSLQLLDFNNILTKLSDTYDYEACLLGLSSDVPPHPATAANIWLSSSRMHNWNPRQKTPATPWEARIDLLFGSLRKTFDVAEQKEIYDEMQSIWAENQPMIHLAVDQLYIGASNRIGNLRPALMRPYLTHNIDELFLMDEPSKRGESRP